MDTKTGLVGAIGSTALIRIASLSQETGCEILGKAEFMSPGGSVKDRAARVAEYRRARIVGRAEPCVLPGVEHLHQ